MVDLTPMLTTIGCAVIGSSAGFGFIQFLISRHDKKKEDAKIDQFDILRKEFQQGLDERENTGKKRYDEHRLAIEQMNLNHQKDFMELKKAIEKLTENDTKITNSIEKMADKQDIMADSLIGQAHDRIIYLTDKISERGAITIKEKSTLSSMYEPYRKLGGNGHCRTAVEYVDTLNVVSDDEAKEMDIRIKNKQREIV